MVEYKAVFEVDFIDMSSTWNKVFSDLPNAPKEVTKAEQLIVTSEPLSKEQIKIIENEFAGKTLDNFKIITFRYLRTICDLND